MSPVKLGLSAVVIVVLGIAIVGIGMGSAPAKFPGPKGAELTASKQRIKAGNAQVQKGKQEFADHGCGDCHSLAATGDDGKLGPRMDRQADPVGVIVENIVKPNSDITPGFEGHLMPGDYAKRIPADDIQAIAAFIKAASGNARPGGPPGGGPPPGGGAPPGSGS